MDNSRDPALEGLSHFTSEPAARKLEKAHPAVAARLWRGQGFRIINAKKSKYYDAAIAYFRSAKRCFEAAGFASEWDETVRVVRADHRRKTGFLSEFDRLAVGLEETKEPSFLERAKEGWGKRNRGEGK